MSVEWIKLKTDMFQNRKIRQIEALINGDAIIVIWCKLLCLAGLINDDGRIYITKTVAYDNESLAIELRKDKFLVKEAVEALVSLDMLEYDGDFLCVANWYKYQNIEGLEKIKEQNRIRKQKQRSKERNTEAKPKNEQDAGTEPEKPKKKQKEDVKHKHGSFNNVLLTDEEYEKLKEKFTDVEERIERLSMYISSSGKSYKSHYATILSWAKKDEANQGTNKDEYYKTMTTYYKNKNRNSFYTEGRGTDYDKLFEGLIG